MGNKPKQILKTVFGYDAFRPLQADIIENVLGKNDTVVIMPTGGGKSLCYQIPALIFPGLTVVVSPLISLMKDQVEQLHQMGAPATFLNSSLTIEQYRQNVGAVKKGAIRLLYVAPEALLRANMLTMLSSLEVDCLAIDEAHCISEWGHDFRPEYRQIAEVRNRFPDAVCVALTATATPRVREDIKTSLGFKTSDEFVSSFDRKNLFIQVTPKHVPFEQTLSFIRGFPGQSGIIYCFSRRQVDQLYGVLQDEGFSVRPYHAGMGDRDRDQNQELFIRDDVQIMVATIAFGMGIDKPNVRFVVHYDMPKNIESYYQEIGRAGRDGLPAHCLLLFSYGDIQKIKHFINQKEEHEQRVASIHLNALLGFMETETCRRIPLLNYFGEAYSKENCGMCDNCLIEEKDLEDITIAAQKFVSCAKRTGERFGAGHIIDVLRGSKAKKVLKFGHQHLSTYGIGEEFSKRQWFHLSRQFIQKRILVQDMEFGNLKLTKKAWKILRGEESVLGRLEEERVERDTERASEKEYDRDLFEILRKERKRLADMSGVPPYVIFSDKSLIEMATYFPQSKESVLDIHGVGAVKQERYGSIFLSILQEYCGIHGIEEREKVIKKKPTGTAGSIRKRGPVEAVEKHYSADSSVDQYALRMAHSVLEMKCDSPLDKSNDLDEDLLGVRRIISSIPVKKPDSAYSDDRILRIRTKYPRAYEPWAEEEDALLVRLPSKYRGLDILAEVFQRQPSAIKSRIKRLMPDQAWKLRGGSLGSESDRELRVSVSKGDITNLGDQQNGFTLQLICLANSRKYSGRCVAGKEFSGNRVGEWVRPVSNRETGELSLKETCYRNGDSPALLDVMAVPLATPDPRSYQTENYIVDTGQWIRKHQFPLSDLSRLCDPVDSLWINGYQSNNGLNDRMPEETVKERIRSSLLFIRPGQVSIIVEEGPNLLKRVRSRFTFAGADYWLSVTDPVIENRYFPKDVGQYPINKKNIYLTISIGEPYDGYCYKLVAAVIGL
ncbi:MAG: DNA helicase RecQ [Desulfobacteraceae bacterium]|nr:DNA helicase RecQ [Desulfobacteraceae bacterium]